MRLALVTMGTLGDVHPMLGLGRAMAARGHHVTVLCNPVFEDLVRRQGLDFVAVGTVQQQVETLAHPKMWHPVDGMGVMWRYLLCPALGPTVKALDEWRLPLDGGGRCLVVASPLAMGARLAAEAFALPLVSAYTSATLLRTFRSPKTWLQWHVPDWMPAGLVRGAWYLIDRFKLQPLLLPALNALRSDLGQSSLTESVFGQWMHSPHGGLTLFPSWFAPLAPEWPAHVRQGDFPLFDDMTPLDPALQSFLEKGSEPVVVTPGTGQVRGAQLFRAAASALRARGLRGVLLGDVPADVVHGAGPTTLWCGPHQSFAQLLPFARAAVHHAGVGTAAQAMRAGIPQMLWPQAYDQFDNAARLERLGVARRLLTEDLTPEGFGRTLDALLDSAAMKRAAWVRSQYFGDQESGLIQMCQQLEDWA